MLTGHHCRSTGAGPRSARRIDPQGAALRDQLGSAHPDRQTKPGRTGHPPLLVDQLEAATESPSPESGSGGCTLSNAALGRTQTTPPSILRTRRSEPPRRRTNSSNWRASSSRLTSCCARTRARSTTTCSLPKSPDPRCTDSESIRCSIESSNALIRVLALCRDQRIPRGQGWPIQLCLSPKTCWRRRPALRRSPSAFSSAAHSRGHRDHRRTRLKQPRPPKRQRSPRASTSSAASRCVPLPYGEPASPKGVPSESRQITQRSPG
jgi:hypothetical protein